MADERHDTPEAFIQGMREAIREELEPDYARRLLNARQVVRRAQDQADADVICRDRERSAERMAEYRRGRWYHLGAIVASGCVGFVGGFLAQKNFDFRFRGAPVAGIGGVPGMALGTVLDESMAARACLAVGGAMFSVGAATYTQCNPGPTNGLVVEEKV